MKPETKLKLERLRKYVIARLQESSTWRGLVLIATALGAKAQPQVWEAVVTSGLMIAGMIAVIFPDRAE